MVEFAAVVSAFAAVLAAVGTFVTARRIQDVHVSINSRMDQLLTLTAEAENAKGVIQGRSEMKP